MREAPYIGYLRVSTVEQAIVGAGLDAQRATIQAEADRRGWEELVFVEDAGVSGKTIHRPGLRDALGQLSAGEAAGLVASKTDRVSRSLGDFVELMSQAQREGWSLVVLDAPVDLDTPAGEAMASIVATFSQLERRMIGQRTKDALAIKRAQGIRLGRPPTIPPKVAARIRRARSRGTSLRGIAAQLNRADVPTPHGGAEWRPSSLESVLKPKKGG